MSLMNVFDEYNVYMNMCLKFFHWVSLLTKYTQIILVTLHAPILASKYHSLESSL